VSNSLLLDIVNILVNADVCDGDGVDAFRDYLPDEPEEIVVLSEYESPYPRVHYEEKIVRLVQVLARSNNPDTARTRALAAYNALVDYEKGKIFNGRLMQVHLRSTPFKHSVNTNKSIMYAFNMGVTTSNI
jgi:hypothetical protein